MPRIFRGLFKWSLQITGLSIVLFNYQPYDRKQRLLALYRCGVNSCRAIGYLYGVARDARELISMQVNAPEYSTRLQAFKASSAQRIQQLCEVNKGVYARLGQIMARMTGVLPQPYIASFGKLQDLQPDEVPYEDVKVALTETLGRPMTQVFDGFVKKPNQKGLLVQQHKSILLQNYKQSLVRVLLPSTRYQCEYDLWVINKGLEYVRQYVSSHAPGAANFQQYESVVKEAEQMVLNEVNFSREVQNADKLADLMQEAGSPFYIPYYYKRYANRSVLIKQCVEGVPLSNRKGLREIGLTAEVAYAYMMAELHKVMTRVGLISGELNEGEVLLRKYIKPAKRKEREAEEAGREDPAKERKERGKAITSVLHPSYQVVFTNLSTLQEIPKQTGESIHDYWVNIRKEAKKKLRPSVASFYERIPTLNNLKNSGLDLMRGKYYLYEPMLRIYEKIVVEGGEKAKK